MANHHEDEQRITFSKKGAVLGAFAYLIITAILAAIFIWG